MTTAHSTPEIIGGNNTGLLDYGTPDYLFEYLNAIFHFTIDVCANEKNHKCKQYFTPEDNGLAQSWSGEICWCNPPYGRQMKLWIKKAYEETRKPGTTVVMLIPNRSCNIYFHEYVIPHALIIHFKGRIQFIHPEGKKNKQAPWPALIIIFNSLLNRNQISLAEIRDWYERSKQPELFTDGQ